MHASLMGRVLAGAAVVALMGAGCAGGAKSDPAAAFKAGLESGNKAAVAVTVSTPSANSTVGSSTHIEGSGATPGAMVYAGLYEYGTMASESQVTAKEDGSFVFNLILVPSKLGASIELRVYEKDEVGNPIKFVKIPLTHEGK